jgi:hypothetical protein
MMARVVPMEEAMVKSDEELCPICNKQVKVNSLNGRFFIASHPNPLKQARQCKGSYAQVRLPPTQHYTEKKEGAS